MSTYKAIAVVTKTLQHILTEQAQAVQSGVDISISRPDDRNKNDPNASAINIYLYQAVVNPNLRNFDLPTRSADGRLVQRSVAALDLFYLFSFYGPDLVPQLLMGKIVSTLNAQPLLTRQQIREALLDQGVPRLDNKHELLPADIDQVEGVRFVPVHLDLEALSKMWSVFYQTPYSLSIAYQASAVLIEQAELPQPALPVRRSGASSAPGGLPQIEQITQFAAPGGQIVLSGRNLAGEGLQVRFDRLDALVDTAAGNGGLQVTLPPGLWAGIRSAQVIRRQSTATGSVELASNPAAFVLRPRVTGDPQTGTWADPGRHLRDGKPVRVITVTVDPAVQPEQRAVLLLNQIDYAPGASPAAYALPALSAAQATATNTLAFDIETPGVRAGTYLVRVQIDGAESQLQDPAGPDERYAGPTVEVTAP